VTGGDHIDVAVRRDEIQLRRPGTHAAAVGWNEVSARVRAIEYQGSFVKVMLDTGGESEFVVYMGERQFFEDAFDVGDVVLATWQAERSRLLA
jgi:putative spermidine/putrescine transport system ATP-binding protein